MKCLDTGEVGEWFRSGEAMIFGDREKNEEKFELCQPIDRSGEAGIDPVTWRNYEQLARGCSLPGDIKLPLCTNKLSVS
jgi:hypothetical protein